MKKLMVLVMVVCMLGSACMHALAGGEIYTFAINGFEYEFGHGDIQDGYSVADNSSLCIKSYNGSELVDVNTLPNGFPEGIALSRIMEVTQLAPEYNWEIHKNEYIPLNLERTKRFLYLFNSNNSVTVRADRADGTSEFLQFPDQAPIIANDRTLLPIRAIAEYYGWSVNWDEAKKRVTIENTNAKIEVDIGRTDASVNNGLGYILLDVPALILNGRTLLPVRAVAEAMGVTVDWNQAEGCVILSQ